MPEYAIGWLRDEMMGKRTVLVTGAARGIGKGIADAFLRAGHRVMIADLGRSLDWNYDLASDHALKEALDDLSTLGEVESIEVDVTQETSCQRAIDKTLDAFGQIDVLVNNAGIAAVGNLEACDEEELDRIYRVNVKGVYNLLHAVVPAMATRGAGVILNMGSIASLIGITDRFAYSMSKGAVLTMTLSVAKDYVDKGIRCNCICPARVHTPFVDGYLSKNFPGEEQELSLIHI